MNAEPPTARFQLEHQSRRPGDAGRSVMRGTCFAAFVDVIDIVRGRARCRGSWADLDWLGDQRVTTIGVARLRRVSSPLPTAEAHTEQGRYTQAAGVAFDQIRVHRRGWVISALSD